MEYNNHFSVLMNETINSLNIKENGIYIDCTFGRGGHSLNIDKHLKNGTIIVIDKDLDAIKYANKIKDQFKNKLIIIHDDFNNIENIFKDYQINEVDGFLFDLGVSSPQIDNPQRGFSYNANVVLDMRMNQDQSLDAKYVLNHYSLEQLINIFKEYGECKDAYYVAREIIKQRENKEIIYTNELAEIIKKSVNINSLVKKNPLKAYFQAIRIEVNNELDSLEKTLTFCINHLSLYGRISVISFHSLEDKIVKKTFLNILNSNKLPDYLPVENESKYKLFKKVLPSNEEIMNNKRSKSATLRTLERIKI